MLKLKEWHTLEIGIGILLTNELYWSDETCRIFAIKPHEFGATYDSFYSYVHPDDRDYVDNAVKEALNGKPHEH